MELSKSKLRIFFLSVLSACLISHISLSFPRVMFEHCLTNSAAIMVSTIYSLSSTKPDKAVSFPLDRRHWRLAASLAPAGALGTAAIPDSELDPTEHEEERLAQRDREEKRERERE
uniref:Uncharacterized protein n=1 Tax=Arundo donax TaxID=35708 RepID=A0A0A9AAU5_ARUDO